MSGLWENYTAIDIAGEVLNYAALPAVASHPGQYYMVKENQGTWILGTLKRKGIWRSDGAQWLRMGEFPTELTTLTDGSNCDSLHTHVPVLSGFTQYRIPFGSAAGGLEDDADFSFDGANLCLKGGIVKITEGQPVAWYPTTGFTSFFARVQANEATGLIYTMIDKPHIWYGGALGITKTMELSSAGVLSVAAITDNGADITIENNTSNADIIFKVNDGGVDTEVMRVNGSYGVLAIPNGSYYSCKDTSAVPRNTLGITASNHTHLRAVVGDLILENDSSDSDIILKVNDGGVDTEILRLDASAPKTTTAYPIESTLATGTAPLTIASTTVCTNLNADKLDGADLETTWTDSDTKICSSAAMEDKVAAMIAAGGGGYTHPNHSGDVTSVGDGAQTIANKQTVTFSNPVYTSQAMTVVAAGGAPTVNLKNDASNAITGIETTWTSSDLKIPTSLAMATKASALIAAGNAASATTLYNVSSPLSGQHIYYNGTNWLNAYDNFTSGVGTSGITLNTNYAMFPAAGDTITLPVGTYLVNICFSALVATSTVSGILKFNIRGAGAAVGSFTWFGSGSITLGGAGGLYRVAATALGTAFNVTAASAVAGRVYTAQGAGILKVTSSGTIIPAYQWSATLTSGVVTLYAENMMEIRQIANTGAVTTQGGWA